MGDQNITHVIPVADVSRRSNWIMRILDRLKPGSYMISLTKGESPAMPWKIKVYQVEEIQSNSLPK